MKRFFSLCCVFIFCICLFGCGNKKSADTSSGSSASVKPTVYDSMLINLNNTYNMYVPNWDYVDQYDDDTKHIFWTQDGAPFIFHISYAPAVYRNVVGGYKSALEDLYGELDSYDVSYSSDYPIYKFSASNHKKFKKIIGNYWQYDGYVYFVFFYFTEEPSDSDYKYTEEVYNRIMLIPNNKSEESASVPQTSIISQSFVYDDGCTTFTCSKTADNSSILVSITTQSSTAALYAFLQYSSFMLMQPSIYGIFDLTCPNGHFTAYDAPNKSTSYFGENADGSYFFSMPDWLSAGGDDSLFDDFIDKFPTDFDSFFNE